MPRKRAGLRSLSVLALCVAMWMLPVTPARAGDGGTVVGPNYVFDNFNRVEVKQPGDLDNDPYWWVVAAGDDGPVPRNCSDASCVTAQRQGHTRFADLTLSPDQTPGNYTLAEISELWSGFSYGTPTQWTPTPGHPVIMSVRARFSSGYNQDGTGGAVGSAGAWLWNSPFDWMSPEPFKPMDAIGFDWSQDGSILGAGLSMTVLQGTYPVYRQPVAIPVNIQNWNRYTNVWSVDGGGTQSVFFFVNGVLTGHTTLGSPLSSLSVETWNDNQVPVGFDEGGQPIIEFNNPPADQSYQMDMLALAKP